MASRKPQKRSDTLTQQVLRQTTQLTIAEDAASDQAVALFEKALGGRDALLNALVVGDNAPEVDKVVTLLLDPRYARYSLRRLCHDSGISVADLFVAFKQAALSKAHLLATQTIIDRVLPVVDDVMTRSAPYYQTCEACEGNGQVTPDPTKKVPNPEPAPCKACKGKGQQVIMPDLDRQKLALELADLIKRGGGISLTQNTATINPGALGTGSLEQLQQAMAERWKAPDVLDAVVDDLTTAAETEAAEAPVPGPTG